MSVLGRAWRIVSRILLGLLAWLVFIQTVVRLLRRYVKFPAPAFTSVFLNSPCRRALQPPAQVVRWMDFAPGMQALEVGAGPGTYTLEAARQVGPGGHVYAVDIQPAMIDRLIENLSRAGAGNVSAHIAPAWKLPAPDHSLDRIFMVAVLAELTDKPAALAEFRRALKPDGLLCIGEFLLDPDYPWPKTVIAWCREAGFVPVMSHGSRLYYVLTFRAAE